jgi:hypothetical protein
MYVYVYKHEVYHTPAELVFIYKLQYYVSTFSVACKNEFGIIFIYYNICL